jgi:S1-C subfamily serine protease
MADGLVGKTPVEVICVRALLRTAAVAMASSATTALLFVACTAANGGGRAGQAVPPSAPSAAQPTPARSSPSAEPSTVRVGLPPVAAPSAGAQAAPASPNPAAQVYQQNGASVVNITSLAVVRTGQGQATQPQGIGSGFVIDADGRIATNNHVVQDAQQLAVTFQDKTTVPARLVGRDPDNDLAVIQVDPNAQDDQGGGVRGRIKPVTLGDSDQVTIGETAIAIGSPLGLQQTVTAGIVSARRDPGEESRVPGQQLDLLGGAIQTDAAINPGNSGGPLFSAGGQVIGVNTAILSQSGGNEGIGFAIPINVVKRVSAELIQTGRYRHPVLGVTTIPLAQLGPAARQQLGLGTTQNGLLVVDATDGAQQAGIRTGTRRVTIGGEQIPAGGDIIVAVDGRPVGTGGELRAYIENTKHPGDTVTVTVLRDGQRQDIPVTLGERPARPQEQAPGR